MRRKPRTPKMPQDAARRWTEDQRYGRVPLVRDTTIVAGKTYEWWRCDPAFKPKLPRGAVEGDVTRQVYCIWHTPKYFYVDESRRCLQCGGPFTFTGAEQKYWYETRQFNFRSAPVRCVRCRRQRRSEHALREQVARARRATEAEPRDPAAHLALARAIVDLYERTATGRLEIAIAEARRAAKLQPGFAAAAALEARARALLAESRLTRSRG
jgi:hypothetical protein